MCPTRSYSYTFRVRVITYVTPFKIWIVDIPLPIIHTGQQVITHILIVPQISYEYIFILLCLNGTNGNVC